MIRTPTRYHRPQTPEEVGALLAEHGEAAAVLGGGSWLLPLMNRGERSHEHLIDLAGLGLEAVTARDGEFELAAGATYEDVLADADLVASVPLLAQMSAGITGGRQLRNRATLVGSACFQNPSSEAPAMFRALAAVFRVHGPAGEREVEAADFFRGAYETALEPGEFVLGARFAGSRRGGYEKLKIAAGGWPVGTAIACRDDAGSAVLVLGAIEAVPLRLELDQLRRGDGAIDLGGLEHLVDASVTAPWDDVLGDAEYRRAIAAPLARRAIEQMEAA
jgi:carbon-monoxide dehydrogenase medium subunit